jgi:predicted transcriptional regulator
LESLPPQVEFVRAKELAMDVIRRLPENASMHELTEELYAAAVREGLDELDRKEGIAHEEVQRQFDSWFTK